MADFARRAAACLLGLGLAVTIGGSWAAGSWAKPPLAPPAATGAEAAAGTRLAHAGNAQGAPACVACHGARGEGQGTLGAPRLAGLNAAYIERQLADFADGSRESAVMTPVAKALAAPDRAAVARYYSTLPPPPIAAAPPQSAGAMLAERGDWAASVPACAACHGRDGQGVGAAFPPLAGQPAAYLVAQLQAFRSGTRHDDPLGLMRGIAARLSETQGKAVAAYYAGGAVPVAAPPAAAPKAPTTPSASLPAQAQAQAQAALVFTPPLESAIPAGPFGDMVRQGEAIFRDTPRYAGRYIGNHLSCANCHLDAGRLANSAPLWAAYVAYPAYRKKNHQVNSYAARLQGCFRFSMNGKPPPAGSKVLLALESYSYFLAKGAPTGISLAGRGYPKLSPPPQKMDYASGKIVYQQKCALCHGPEGAGQAAGGAAIFPALWGAQSYNWGAGMAAINNAADFVKANMPLSQGGSLTVQQAWDVALFIDSHERPQDPRFLGATASTRAKFHNTPMSMYGEKVNGRLLGQGLPKSP